MNTQSVSRTPRHRRVTLVFWVLSAAVVVGSAHARKATAAQKCTAAKQKLVGREIAALTACDARAVARGVVVDPSRTAKARSRFVTAWGKAEKAADGACITRDDVTTIGVIVDAHAADLEATLGLDGAASKCIAGKFKAVGKDDACELGCQAKAAAKGSIQKFTNTGIFLTKWGSLGLGAGQFSDNESVTVDANGDVFVADVDRIQKFTNDGTFVTEWGSLGNQDGQFNSVLGVAAGPAGSIYTTDFNHRVQKFACP